MQQSVIFIYTAGSAMWLWPSPLWPRSTRGKAKLRAPGKKNFEQMLRGSKGPCGSRWALGSSTGSLAAKGQKGGWHGLRHPLRPEDLTQPRTGPVGHSSGPLPVTDFPDQSTPASQPDFMAPSTVPKGSAYLSPTQHGPPSQSLLPSFLKIEPRTFSLSL